jgi:hypothetical protein
VQEGVWRKLLFSWSLGLTLLILSQRYLYSKIQSCYDSLFFTLYLLALRLEIAVNIEQIYMDPGILKITQSSNPRFEHLPIMVRELLNRVKEGGEFDRSQVRALLDLSQELYEQDLERFSRQIQTIKFFILAIFFLGSYLYHLIHIISGIEFLT